LTGVDVDTNRELPTIEIMLGSFTHSVADVRQLKVNLSLEGDEDGLDLIEASGRTTILRFEK
jgi:hypothetical protein